MIKEIKATLNEAIDNVIFDLEQNSSSMILQKIKDIVILIPQNFLIDEKKINKLFIENLDNINSTNFYLSISFTYRVRDYNQLFASGGFDLIEANYEEKDIEKLFDRIFEDLKDLKNKDDFIRFKDNLDIVINFEVIGELEVFFNDLIIYSKEPFISLGVTKIKKYIVKELFWWEVKKMISKKIEYLTNKMIDKIIKNINSTNNKLIREIDSRIYFSSSVSLFRDEFDLLINENLDNIDYVYIDFDLSYLDRGKNFSNFHKYFYIVSKSYDELNLEKIYSDIDEVYNCYVKENLENFHKECNKDIFDLDIRFSFRASFNKNVKFKIMTIDRANMSIIKFYRIEDLFW